MLQELQTQARAGLVGSKLPSQRELVARFRASPVTVAAVVAQLVTEGLATTVPGRGTFIAARPQPQAADYGWQSVALGSSDLNAAALRTLVAAPRPDQRPLSSGYLSAELQPVRELMAATSRALRRPQAWEGADPAGLPELRRLFSAPLGIPGMNALIVPSGQAGLSTIFRALAGGETVLLEEPTYPGAVAAARSAGVAVAAAPTDDAGLRPELLAAALAQTGSRLVYAQPTFANPTGRCLAAERRQQILQVVTAAGAFLIEDDWARDLAIESAPAPLVLDDQHGHVVYLRSLTKSAAPSLRVAAILSRGPVSARLADCRLTADFFVSRVLQEAAIELLSSAGWNRHLARVRRELRLRRDALLAALVEFWPEATVTHRPLGGLHLWVRLPASVDGIDGSDWGVMEQAARAGLTVGAGSAYHLTPAAPHLRLSFGALSPQELREAVAELATVVV